MTGPGTCHSCRPAWRSCPPPPCRPGRFSRQASPSPPPRYSSRLHSTQLELYFTTQVSITKLEKGLGVQETKRGNIEQILSRLPSLAVKQEPAQQHISNSQVSVANSAEKKTNRFNV